MINNTIDIKKTALLVIDMQNDFVLKGAIMEVPDAKKQVPKIKELIEICRKKNIPVIYTVHETDPVLCPLEVVVFPHLKTQGMRKGTKGVEIVDGLKPLVTEKVVTKHRYSAFYNTDLEEYLKGLQKDNPIDTLIICGTVTNICCESTARDAFFRDYKVILVSDCCSAVSVEAQAASIANMSFLGKAMSGQEIKEMIG